MPQGVSSTCRRGVCSVLLAVALWWGGAAPMAMGVERTSDAGSPGPAGTGAVKHVLWLAMSPMSRAVLAVDGTFRATLKAGLPEKVTVYAEYLEMTLFEDEGPRGRTRGVLRREVREDEV